MKIPPARYCCSPGPGKTVRFSGPRERGDARRRTRGTARQHLHAIDGELGRQFQASCRQEAIVDEATTTYDDLREH